MSDITAKESREQARKIRAEVAAAKEKLAEEIRLKTRELQAAAKLASPVEASRLRQQVRDMKNDARKVKGSLYAQQVAARESHRAVMRETAIEAELLRTQRRAEKASIEYVSKHTYDAMGNRHKIDTPNTLIAKDAAIKLAREVAYNEFAYYPQDTLFLQLSDHTKIFITDGVGVVSKAREEIESIANRKSYPDYEVIASIIYPSAFALQTARQKDKALIQVDFCLEKYLTFLFATAELAITTGDVMASTWCIMASTGCRANELLTDWQTVNNKYLKYDTPKVALTSNNLSISLLPLNTLQKLRVNIKHLERHVLANIIATQHKLFIQALPMLVGTPPRFTRDIYQCLAYKTLLNYGEITAAQFTNYVSHRMQYSSVFLAYTGVKLSENISIPEFLELAKHLHFI